AVVQEREDQLLRRLVRVGADRYRRVGDGGERLVLGAQVLARPARGLARRGQFRLVLVHSSSVLSGACSLAVASASIWMRRYWSLSRHRSLCEPDASRWPFFNRNTRSTRRRVESRWARKMIVRPTEARVMVS